MNSKKSVSLVSPMSQGNTNNLRHKTSRNRSRSWCFTWNNYTPENLSHLSQPNYFPQEIKKMIFQEELGKENTKHLQGFIQFKNQIDFRQIKKYLPKCHLGKCNSVTASIKYCSKEDTRSGTRYTYGISDSELFKKKLPPLTEEELLIGLENLANEETEQLFKEGKCVLCTKKLPCGCPEL